MDGSKSLYLTGPCFSKSSRHEYTPPPCAPNNSSVIFSPCSMCVAGWADPSSGDWCCGADRLFTFVQHCQGGCVWQRSGELLWLTYTQACTHSSYFIIWLDSVICKNPKKSSSSPTPPEQLRLWVFQAMSGGTPLNSPWWEEIRLHWAG